MNSISHMLVQLCSAAAEGAHKTYEGLEDLMEVAAVLLARFEWPQTAATFTDATVTASEVPPEIAATGFYARMGVFTDTLFAPIFDPMNRFLAGYYEPWAQIVTVSYFIGAWVWVAFVLKKEYVNLSCPYKSRLADLRIWTLVAMLPTMFVYLYFN